MNKHTPGPWHVEGRAINGGERDDMLALVNLAMPAADAYANARLIAAAPELYEALRKLRAEVGATLSLSEAAIAEAAGVTNLRCLTARCEEADAILAKVKE
jgi:hypothetical protein